MSYETTVKDGYMETKKSIRVLEESLKGLPKGKIIQREIRGKVYYYLTYYGEKHRTVYIPRCNVEKIKEQLQQRKMFEKQLKEYVLDCKKYERALRICGLTADDIWAVELEKEKENRQSQQQKLHEEKQAHSKPYGEQYRIQTLRGEFVQSKSEMIIANVLAREGISYEYERPIQIGNYRFRPDFTIYCNGKTKYWEHCGLMHDARYMRQWNQKLERYREHGIIPGGNLIITYEDKENILTQQKVQHALKMALE